MATKTKTTKTTKASAKKAAPKKAAAKQATNGKTNKRMLCVELLTRKQGCTTKDLLAATGWPAISVPAVAKASGLKLRKEKEGRTTTYFGSAA